MIDTAAVLIHGSAGIGKCGIDPRGHKYPSRSDITKAIVRAGRGWGVDQCRARGFVTMGGSDMDACISSCLLTLTRNWPNGFNQSWDLSRVPPGRGKGAKESQMKRAVGTATHAIIFWDGRSKGTQRLIDMVEAKDIPFIVHMVG